MKSLVAGAAILIVIVGGLFGGALIASRNDTTQTKPLTTTPTPVIQDTSNVSESYTTPKVEEVEEVTEEVYEEEYYEEPSYTPDYSSGYEYNDSGCIKDQWVDGHYRNGSWVNGYYRNSPHDSCY